MSPDRTPTLSWYRLSRLAWSPRPIWVIKQCSSPVKQSREGRVNQAGAQCSEMEGAGKARGLSAEMEKPPHQGAPLPLGRGCLHHGCTRKCTGRQGHHQLACCVLLPWQTSQGPVKTDDKNNNMKCNHQGLAFHILPLHIISSSHPFFVKKKVLASFAQITSYKYSLSEPRPNLTNNKHGLNTRWWAK